MGAFIRDYDCINSTTVSNCREVVLHIPIKSFLVILLQMQTQIPIQYNYSDVHDTDKGEHKKSEKYQPNFPNSTIYYPYSVLNK